MTINTIFLRNRVKDVKLPSSYRILGVVLCGVHVGVCVASDDVDSNTEPVRFYVVVNRSKNIPDNAQYIGSAGHKAMGDGGYEMAFHVFLTKIQ